uniref:Ciliary microtubule inner protein 5 n=1 Tax=Pseudonaja textilis TaxID=8673 RepID=A0A670Z9S8_PSETE
MGSQANGARSIPPMGYLLPATSSAGNLASYSSLSLSSRAGRSPLVTSGKASSKIRWEEHEALKRDQVQQDKIWREAVEAERKATKYCFDMTGKKKASAQLPEYISIFSDKIPNTTNHVIGSRMNTDLGKTLIKMDYFLNYGKRKTKTEQELQPS